MKPNLLFSFFAPWQEGGVFGVFGGFGLCFRQTDCSNLISLLDPNYFQGPSPNPPPPLAPPPLPLPPCTPASSFCVFTSAADFSVWWCLLQLTAPLEPTAGSSLQRSHTVKNHPIFAETLFNPSSSSSSVRASISRVRSSISRVLDQAFEGFRSSIWRRRSNKKL